ncbi:unnamed protein product [Rotaria sp. Silwood2]|nr:unnamed protein product [Rotaria sp. Silwood2]
MHNLVPVDYDYILMIDTEGLLSIDKDDEQYDKRLILFCLAVSHLVIVNVAGEINEALKRMLLLCTQSLNYIGETRVTKPAVHFISNQNADPNKENYEKQVKIIRTDLINHGLDNLIDLGPNNFHVLSTAFNRKPFLDPNGDCAALSTDIKFVTSVQNLCKLFIHSSSEIVNGTGDLFSVPTNWIEFAQRVFQTLKSYPDLTFFKDIFERQQHFIWKTGSSKGNRSQAISQEISSKWVSIFRVSYCFDKLIEDITTILISKSSDEPSTGISLLQEVLEVVDKLIQDINLDFKVFNFGISKIFQGALHTCAVISVALFYFNQHKTRFNEMLRSIHEKKIQLQDRFVRMVIPQENCDENIATNLVNEITEALRQSFDAEANKTIRKQLERESAKLNRSSIIKQLDNEVHDASDEWLMRYILHPLDMIIERFHQLWTEIDTNIHLRLNKSMNEHLKILVEFFQVIERVNEVLKLKGAHVLTFFDDLFELSSNDGNHDSSEKKMCMATLLYQYFIGEPSSTCITTKTGATYTVNTKWQEVAGHFPSLNEPLKDVFRSIRSTFETFNISYLSLFLRTVTSYGPRTETAFRNQMNELVETSCKSIREQWLIRLHGCKALCPCCRRLCDVDHHLDNTSHAGQGENRHRCQFGHQMRGMAGIKYELTHEASIERCESIKDDSPIITRQGIRQRWQEFKNSLTDWDFGDSKTVEIHGARYVYIWKKIGQRLCSHFGNGMKFVEQNSPSIINHFILVIDHSSSMNSNGVWDSVRRIFSASQPISTIINSNEQTNLSPWEYLLKAVQEFIHIRIQEVHSTDRMTIIVFGSRAIQLYDRVKLNEINIEEINTPISTCGRNTNFSLAFQMVIETLDKIVTEPMQENFRQTIIFMTDGKPKKYPTAELEHLSTVYRSMIVNFWTMGLGEYDMELLEKVNTTMKGKFVDVTKPEDLGDAYADIAFS